MSEFDYDYWTQKKFLQKLNSFIDSTRVNEMTPEERLFDALFNYKVFLTLGGDGNTIQLFTDLDEKINLFDLSFCKDPENDPTIKYLSEHDIDEIFAGNNPDMIPDNVSIIEGGNGIIEINFKCSAELKAAGVYGRFHLNRNLDNAVFGAMIKGHRSKKHLIGYSKSDKQEPYVKTFCGNGITCQMTFDIVSRL